MSRKIEISIRTDDPELRDIWSSNTPYANDILQEMRMGKFALNIRRMKMM